MKYQRELEKVEKENKELRKEILLIRQGKGSTSLVRYGTPREIFYFEYSAMFHEHHDKRFQMISLRTILSLASAVAGVK